MSDVTVNLWRSKMVTPNAPSSGSIDPPPFCQMARTSSGARKAIDKRKRRRKPSDVIASGLNATGRLNLSIRKVAAAFEVSLLLLTARYNGCRTRAEAHGLSTPQWLKLKQGVKEMGICRVPLSLGCVTEYASTILGGEGILLAWDAEFASAIQVSELVRKIHSGAVRHSGSISPSTRSASNHSPNTQQNEYVSPVKPIPVSL
ncbi:hypothetical protein BV22DRAFT_1132341 [Leucogyrophana mollusca]|uniref:Uncharacterized protein n=1 Tax=Leucogyrophana mollusca TaxID=85980 RepID=A0ACB8B6E1_9AGAM|nr:hypothetical protein BV22DRAFT_1132341 [Leucogyrophana mollusca]